MQKIKTVLRLAGLGLSQRQIALSCPVGQATVSDYLRMAAAAGIRWPEVADWDEDRLRAALAPASIPAPNWRKAGDPDYAEIRRDLEEIMAEFADHRPPPADDSGACVE